MDRSGSIGVTFRFVVLLLLVLATSASAEGPCCFPNGECLILPRTSCGQLGGVFVAEGASCEPATCVELFGVCCHSGGWCVLLTYPECIALHESGSTYCGFMGGIDSCDPNPCPCCCSSPCCFPDGRCEMILVGECEPLGGYSPDIVACYPDPCGISGAPDDLPPRWQDATWGEVKRRYR